MQNPIACWRVRSELKRQIRTFFESRSYLELDTPIAVTCPGTEVHLDYFCTEWQDYRAQKHELFLRSSPELHLKQALAMGQPRVFQMATCFRNSGELALWHHPEFTMLEYYQAHCSFDAFISLTEELLHSTHAALTPFVRQELGQDSIALPTKFHRLTVEQAFREFAGLNLIDQDPGLARLGREQGALSVNDDDDFETAFFKLLIEKVEPGLARLGGAVLLDYPPSQAALARIEGGVAKRFEFYLARVELCNGFYELLDLDTNQARIRAANERRRALGYDVPPEDREFYAALAKGLPPACGNALGFDRWLALLMGDEQRGLERAIPFRRAGVYAPPTET